MLRCSRMSDIQGLAGKVEWQFDEEPPKYHNRNFNLFLQLNDNLKVKPIIVQLTLHTGIWFLNDANQESHNREIEIRFFKTIFITCSVGKTENVHVILTS